MDDVTYKGELILLRGLPGSGKTTLVKLLVGLYQAQEGNILYSGIEANEIDLDALREKILCIEDPAYTVDYHDPSKRSIANAITITCTDGTVFGEEVVEYPIGHARRRVEGIPLLIVKFKINLARIFPADQQKKILDLCLDRSKLEATPVEDFMSLLVK
jgi:2-methylcitrate dehydratase